MKRSPVQVRLILHHSFSTGARSRLPLKPTPSPPRLPEKEQKLFEELQRASTGAFSTPRSSLNQSPASTSQSKVNQSPRQDLHVEGEGASTDEGLLNAKIEARGKGEELHPDVRRGAAPEFEGERNPKTGEVGGPKNEPLRWGANADWSYNGRVTDF